MFQSGLVRVLPPETSLDFRQRGYVVVVVKLSCEARTVIVVLVFILTTVFFQLPFFFSPYLVVIIVSRFAFPFLFHNSYYDLPMIVAVVVSSIVIVVV